MLQVKSPDLVSGGAMCKGNVLPAQFQGAGHGHRPGLEGCGELVALNTDQSASQMFALYLGFYC